VKHIVDRHRGHLEIRSTVGKGTTVSILLPVSPA
jgi:two-component system phosphate regulon sensor histidine kinase PhoR